MASATYDTIVHDIEQLTPEEQSQLMELLEDLVDIRAANEAKVRIASGEDELIPLDQAMAESEAVWSERDTA